MNHTPFSLNCYLYSYQTYRTHVSYTPSIFCDYYRTARKHCHFDDHSRLINFKIVFLLRDRDCSRKPKQIVTKQTYFIIHHMAFIPKYADTIF